MTRSADTQSEIQANEKRWAKAQASELYWWAHYRELPFYRDYPFAKVWSDRMADLAISQSDFKGKNIVEVGCGPHGVVSCIFPDAHKIGIDPLIGKYNDRTAPDINTLLIGAIGESLPIRSDVADLVLCINVIDHVMSAQQVLFEIHRIMKQSARLLLEVHTFPEIFTPIMLFDHPHTYHWSRRRLIRLIKECRLSIDRIEGLRYKFPISRKSRLHPGYWKYVFGNCFMRLTYISAHKAC